MVLRVEIIVKNGINEICITFCDIYILVSWSIPLYYWGEHVGQYAPYFILS